MVRVERSIVINLQPSQVFAYVGTGYIRNYATWASDVTELEPTSSGPMGEGTTMRQVRTIRGKPEESNVRITKFDKPNSLSFEATGSLPVQGSYVFAADGDGTKLTITLDAEPGGLGRLAGPMIGREIGKALQTDLEKLKQIIETM